MTVAFWTSGANGIFFSFFWIVRSSMKAERYKEEFCSMFVIFIVWANSWKESFVVGCRSYTR